jgi:alpha-tubulin suppressor-like RCC1 family protein
VKIGKTHVLALTNFGKVYAWGSNIQGQVGCPPMTEESKGIDKYMTSKGSE